MTSNIWKKWCRLCGKENGDTIDVFIKDENFLSLSDAIQKFLCIAVSYNKLTKKLHLKRFLINILT